jgi:surface antigen
MRHRRSITAALLAGVYVLLQSTAVLADPPPWAPAHGWRKKHDPYYLGYTGKQWPHDYGILNGRCNWQALGTAVGGAVGGAIGSQVKGEGRTVAILLGSVLGAVIGNQIGRAIDEQDRACIGHALELAPDNQRLSWQNPQTGVAYVITPLSRTERSGSTCRKYQLQVTSAGRTDATDGVACRGADDTWEFVR